MNEYRVYRRMANGAVFDEHRICAEDLDKAWLAALDLWGNDYPEAARRVDRVR